MKVYYGSGESFALIVHGYNDNHAAAESLVWEPTYWPHNLTSSKPSLSSVTIHRHSCYWRTYKEITLNI